MVRLLHAAQTDVGMIRSGNEDNYAVHVPPPPPAGRGESSQLGQPGPWGLFVVADGMGGHAAGEVASEMAVQTLERELVGVKDLGEKASAERVTEALRTANRTIHDRTITEVDKQGMGTTASVLLLSGNRYLIGQVGDSRVYLLRDGALRQITKDHSYVQEQVDAGFLTPEQARYHPYSNVITRCVGASPDVQPDIYQGDVRVGDLFLVASDGLTGMVDDRRLQILLMSRAEPKRKVISLIHEANGRGGLDNITAIVVQVAADDDGAGNAKPQ
jgi:PPM family protein phosphatase